jgi:hypothetical protein
MIPWNKGVSWESAGRIHPRLGKHHSEESRQKMKDAAKKRIRPSKLSNEEQRVRGVASQQGEKYYFFPRPCKRGHIAKRFVKTSSCSSCSIEAVNSRWKSRYKGAEPELLLYKSAKQRSKKEGAPFSITLPDIKAVWPKDNRCPIFGVELKGQEIPSLDSPSLDRVIPSLGYVQGNIAVISYAANRMKQDVTDPEIFDRLAVWLESQLCQVLLQKNATNHTCIRPQSRCSCYRMLDSCRRVAQQKGVPFDLTLVDVQQVWPEDNKCPIFGSLLERNTSKGPKATSPSLDKVQPELGYVRGNVAIISHRANRLKNDVTDPEIFRTLAFWLRTML